MKRIALLAAALALTGCTSEATVEPTPPTSLNGGSFEAVEITENGARRTLAPRTKLRMRFETDGTLVAHAGCNQIEAPVTIGPDRLDVGLLRTTAMSCPGARSEQDQWLMAFLADPSWRRDGDGFVLDHGPTSIRLEVPPPTPPDKIVGREWVIHGRVHDGGETGTTPGLPASLTFDGKTVTGNTGCARLRAPATVEPGTIDVGTVDLTDERTCTGSGDTDQRAVLDVLRSGEKITYTFDDNGTLRIMAGEKGLLLSAR